MAYYIWIWNIMSLTKRSTHLSVKQSLLCRYQFVQTIIGLERFHSTRHLEGNWFSIYANLHVLEPEVKESGWLQNIHGANIEYLFSSYCIVNKWDISYYKSKERHTHTYLKSPSHFSWFMTYLTMGDMANLLATVATRKKLYTKRVPIQPVLCYKWTNLEQWVFFQNFTRSST